MVFWYKADDHPTFQIGDPMFWKHHTENYNNGGEQDVDEYDLEHIHSSRNKPRINVKKIQLFTKAVNGKDPKHK